MFNRFSAVWLVLGLVGGYALVGPSATAQSTAVSPVPPFVYPGDHVTLVVDREGSSIVECDVAEVQGVWIRCTPDDTFASQPKQRWVNLQRVIEIQKRGRN